MSKPDDIPQEVWGQTDVIGEQLLGRHERGWVNWPLVIPAREIAARAILAERERCARFHDDMAAEHKRLMEAATDEFDRTFHSKGYQRHTTYAEAIRKGGQ